MHNDGDDELRIVDQARIVHDTFARDDRAAAETLARELNGRHGLQAVAEAMHARDERERLGTEVALLGMFGPAALYGNDSE